MTWLTDPEWQALALSARVAGWATLLCLVPGVGLGWWLARRTFPGKALVESLLFLPMVLPPTVPGYLLLLLFGAQGPIGRWLHEAFGWRFVFDWKGAVLAAAVIALPLMVQSVRVSVRMIDRRLEFAAATLGAPPLKTFCRITLPLALPGIVVGVVMCFCRALGEFGATITFVGNIAGETRTLPLAIYTATQQPGGEEAALRLILISAGFALASLLACQWLTRRAERWRGGRRD